MRTVKSAFKFHGGVHPQYNKELARDKAIEPIPLPKTLAISMSQHLGAPAKCIVNGKKIASPTGYFFTCIAPHESSHSRL